MLFVPHFDADRKITKAAFDATIVRERLAPVYRFAPAEPGDCDFIAGLGLEHAPVILDPVIINLANNAEE